MADEENKKIVKVRFAPSPTGIPHVGNIRTALFDYFLAKSQGGKFILRIEDTDQARKIEGAEEAIKESLLWLGANWDEYVVQSARLDEYAKYARELVAKGMAREDDGAIRFLVPEDESSISWIDAVGSKKISYESKSVEDFIILKKDGFPTYHLANVVDDHLMEITHVIRGEDWIPSTPKHILLYKAFGWEMPIFAHVPNVMGSDGKKLSKRRGAKSVLDFKKEGYLPEALLNYLMLLGWSPKNDKEILKKSDIEKDFSLNGINVSPSIFDERKLQWMNGEYMRSMTAESLGEKLSSFDPTIIEMCSGSEYLRFVASAQTRMKTLADFRDLVIPFVNPSTIKSRLLADYADILSNLSDIDWNSAKITEATVLYMRENDIRYPQIYQDLTGKKQGLPLGDVFEILGKARTLQLLK